MNFNAKRGIILPLSVPLPNLAPSLSLRQMGRTFVAHLLKEVQHAAFRLRHLDFLASICEEKRCNRLASVFLSNVGYLQYNPFVMMR